MNKSIRFTMLALVALGLLALVGSALAAYTKPKLTIAYGDGTTRIVASADINDDATAISSIILPAGTTVTATQAAGSTIGSVKATVSALALGGAVLPLSGSIIVAPPGAIPAASQAQCTQGAAVTAAWILQLELAGQKINLPAYVMPTSGAEAQIGPAKIVFCLAPPDIPVDKGGAANGAKFVSADLTIKGVFSPVSLGAAVAFWTPWQPANGQVNAAGTVASPAAIAPGALTVKVAKAGLVRSKVSGKVTQGGMGFGSAKIEIWAGLKRATLKKVATTTTRADGSYSFTYTKKAAFFRTRTVVAGRAAPPLCTQLQAALPVPCVNPTVNGFTAQSPVAKR
jgi:hypothetical protein